MIIKINFTLHVTEAIIIMGHASKFKIKRTKFQDVKASIMDHACKMVHIMKLFQDVMVAMQCHALLMLHEMKVMHYAMVAIRGNVLEMVLKIKVFQTVMQVIFNPAFKIEIIHAMYHVLLLLHLPEIQVFQDAMVVIQDPA
jgi:hypothetical protein